MLKLPNTHPAHFHLPRSVWFVWHSTRPAFNITLDNRHQNTSSYFSRTLNRPRTARVHQSPGDIPRRDWKAVPVPNTTPVSTAGSFLSTIARLHRLRFKFNRSIRVEEIIYWCKQDLTQTTHRIWPLRDLCKTLSCALLGKILGLEEQFPFFLDLSQDLLPWQGSSSSTHKLLPNTYANSI